MSDLIKRENAIATIGVMYERCGGDITDYRDLLLQCFKDLPSGRPRGEWIDKGNGLWKCSNCGMFIYSEYERDKNEFHKWCSRCGARMKGADDDI